MLYFWDNKENVNFKEEIFKLFNSLLLQVKERTELDLDVVIGKVHIQIISRAESKILNSLDMLNHFSTREIPLFELYNSLPHIGKWNTFLRTPAYVIENSQKEPKLSVSVAKLGASLLLFEPDRIIIISYFRKKEFSVIFWVDGFGEYERIKYWKGSNHSLLVHHIILETKRLFGKYGFFVRLVIDNVNGWNDQEVKGLGF